MTMKIAAFILFLSAGALFAAGQTNGKYAKMFSEQKLKNTIRFLSDDGFEGRAPGSRGGELAAKYIATQLQTFGVKPGNKGSYFQPVSLVAVKSDPATKLNVTGGSGGRPTSGCGRISRVRLDMRARGRTLGSVHAVGE